MSLLELRDVSRSYGEGSASVNALHEVSLSVDQGEMVAVMGPSGSGKSTLLTIAGTLEEPSSGQVLVGGQPVGAMSHAAKARLRRRTIGYVFQDFNLLPGLTAAENRKLLLADEPSGALDSVNGEAVMQLLHDACKTAGMAAVVVTHDAHLASWADRVMFLRDGRVTDQAAPARRPESLLTSEAEK